MSTVKITQHDKRSPEYKIWRAVLRRCTNPKNSCYSYYGGRGITVCREWAESFEQFLSDMGERPDPSYTIERLDVNGNYEPSNCCWVTRTDQARNRRNNINLTFEGKTQTLMEWSITQKISYSTLYRRFKNGLSPQEILTDPIGMRTTANRNKLKTHCKHGHPLDEDNTYVARDRRRGCKICRRENSARYRRRRLMCKVSTENHIEES